MCHMRLYPQRPGTRPSHLTPWRRTLPGARGADRSESGHQSLPFHAMMASLDYLDKDDKVLSDALSSV